MFHFQSSLLFIRQEWRFLLFGLLLAFWSGPGQTYVISVVVGEIRADFNLTNGEFGTLYTVATLICALLLWKAGPLVDRMPLKSIAMKVSLLMVASMVTFGLVQGPISLFFGIIAVRFLGQGMMAHIAMTATARRYEAVRGRALAIAELGFPLGLALYPPLIAFSLGFMDWRFIWPVMAVIAAITLLPTIPFLARTSVEAVDPRAATGEALVSDTRHWTRREVLRDTGFYMLLPSVMLPATVITGFFFHQVYLIEVQGWNFATWALTFPVFAIAHLVGSFSLGVLVDLLGARRLAPFLLLPSAMGILLFAFAPSQAYAVLVMILLGFGSGAAGPALSALWPEIYGTRYLGAIRSVAAVAAVFGSALSPVLVGVALDSGYTIKSIALVFAVGVLCTAILAKGALILHKSGPPTSSGGGK